jgi:myosin heavy subunit
MGVEVWYGVVEDAACWCRAVVQKESDSEVTIKRNDNGAEITLSKAEFDKLSLCTTSELDDVVDDLTQMTDVSDATMLECLRRRYERDEIYTAIGPVIISINPYKKVGGCTSEAISELCKQGLDAPPHITRVACIAYTGLIDATERQPQAVLISGESGAGKTEACKLCLLSLAELSKSSGNATEAALVAAELLEAFGNAKTVYNNNSSRFGKWCAVYFDPKHKIAACQCEVYLLEKTRSAHARRTPMGSEHAPSARTARVVQTPGARPAQAPDGSRVPAHTHLAHTCAALERLHSHQRATGRAQLSHLLPDASGRE